MKDVFFRHGHLPASNCLLFAGTMRMRDNLGPVIEPRANADVQAPIARMLSCDGRKTKRIVRRWCKGKARGAPGALADSMSAGTIKRVQDIGDGGTGEPRTALCPSEVVAKAHLQFFDCGAEIIEVMLGESWECLHQYYTADVRGIRFRHRRQSRERPSLVGAVQAAPIGVENHQNSPTIRERESADDWRRN
jgi:hypothetical protein